jgi:hypothetical protein
MFHRLIKKLKCWPKVKILVIYLACSQNNLLGSSLLHGKGFAKSHLNLVKKW